MLYDLTPERVERFEAKFAKGDPDECWEWQASRFKAGYGQFGWGKPKCSALYAHRIAYQLYVGEIPDGIHVLHECDNPPCVNPNHLFLGTNTDNILDRMKKGRSFAPRGELSGVAKLTESQVLEIRARYKKYRVNRSNAKELAEEFGMSKQQIHTIVHRKQWKHLP